MKLFSGLVAQRINKQDIVIMLSIEVELLAIFQTAKKAIYLFCLIKAFMLIFSKVFTIKCDNTQTKQLLVNKSIKLQTKLCHVNIYFHWLKWKIQCDLIYIYWISTKKIIANDLTKALLAPKYKFFIKIIGFQDQKNCLIFIKKEKTYKTHFNGTNLKNSMKHLDLDLMHLNIYKSVFTMIINQAETGYSMQKI